MKETMKKLTQGATRLLVLALGLGLTATGWADITIPASGSVTGGDETYKYYFAGGASGVWSNTANWKNADGTAYSGTIAPALESSNTWDPILFDGTRCPDNKSITGSSIDGWGLRMGLYNGVTVEMGSPKYWRSNGYAYVDATSRLRITGSSNRNGWVEPVEFVVANTNGIVWTEQFLANGGSANIYYTLIGNGTVCYENRVDGYPSHYIRKVVVTDERPTEKKLVKKTLITFTATGNVTWKTASNATVVLHGITIPLSEYALPSSPTITVNSDVGSCQIVKESNGVYLYYVDGPVQTCTWTPTTVGETVGGLFSDSERWNSTPGLGDDVEISITGDTVLYVDSTKTLGDVSISCSAATAENPVTLTLQGSGKLTADSVSVPAYVTLKLENNVLSAPVEVASNATLDFAFAVSTAYTWDNVISGSGAVKVSANSVTFTVANTFTGGLTIANGGHAKATIQRGFGPASASIAVENGGAIDLATVVVDSSYILTISGEGIDGSGAAYSSSDVGSNFIQLKSLALSGNATIKGEWGLIQSAYTTATALSLSGYKLTKAGTGSFFMADTGVTASNGGSIEVTGGAIAAIGKQQTNYKSTNSNAPITLKSGTSLTVSGFLLSTNITCEQGANISVSSGAYLATYDKTTTTIRGQADISGNVLIGWSAPGAATYLDVAGTVNVNGSGLLQIFNSSIIRKVANSDGVVNIGPNATVEWQNSHWKDTDAGDLFRGTGKLFYNCKGGNYGAYATSLFSGILKIGSRNNTNWAALLGTPPQFAERPELTLACGNSASDMGVLYLGDTYASKSLTVRDLNGFGKINGEWNSSSSTGVRTIDTLQTKNTVFDGTFIKSTTRPASTALLVRGSDTVNSLTLTGASDTPGSLTIQDNAKVVFASTGSWASGTVTVADGGYLESKNASAVAATLDVQSGGTIVIPTVTTTANEVTTTSAVALNAGTITFPDSGEATIDVSAIPDLEADATVTILTATTSLDSDISKIRLVGKPYALQVNGNNLNVVNDGGLVWDSTNGWGTKDATKYDTATITSPGTVALGGTSLVFDTVELTGSGTVSFSATGSETVSIKHLTIGDGVTLDVSSALDLTGCTIAGSGTINVPAGVTYAMSDVTCSAKVTVQANGTLETYGNVELLSDQNVFLANSQFTVKTGSSAQLNASDRGLKGAITVEASATLTNTREQDALNYDGSTILNLYGTLAMGATRWSVKAANTINIYDSAVISGGGHDYYHDGVYLMGALDFVEDNTIYVKGNSEISARLRLRSGSDVELEISSGKTLTFSGSYANYSTGGGIIVSGGVIKLGALNPFVQGNNTCSLTINDGAAIDINGNKPTNQIYLVGDGPDGAGALINTGANMGSDIAMKITLTGDASWGGSYYTHFGASTDIYLDGYTFTKKGSNNFPLNNTVMRGTGKIVVEEGQFQNNNNNNRLDGIDLEVKTGATLNMAGGTSLRIHDFTCSGTISGNAAKLVVNGTYNVNGAQSIPKLEMVTNSAIAFATTSSKLTANTLTFSLPENGKVLLNVAGLQIPSAGMELINRSSTDNFTVSDGYYLDVVGSSVYAYQRVVQITVPEVAHTTVTVTAGGVEQVGVDGDGVKTYSVPYGSAVVVTYAADSGYELSGTATYNIASATSDETITTTDTVANPYVAQIMGGASYTTLAGAIANVTTMPIVNLLADVSEPEITISTMIMIIGNNHAINADVKIADGGTLTLQGATLGSKLTIENGGAFSTSGDTIGELVAKDGATIDLSVLSETTAPLFVTKLTVEGSLKVRASDNAAVRGTTYKALSYVSANATIAQDAEFVGVNEWTASDETDGANTVVCLEMTAVAVVDGVYYDVAQDAVDAAVLSGKPVSFLVAPGTVTIGLNETLIVSGAIQPTVAMDEGLTNPPYDIARTIDENTRYIYTVERYVAKLKNPDYGKTAWLSEVKYTTLAAAVADVIVNNQVGYDAGYVPLVTLLDDISLDATVTVDKRMNLNLNGKTLTASGFDAINNTTRLTIQGSGSVSATSGGSVVLTDAAATLTVSGVTLSPAPTTTAANSYVKLTGSTYSVDTYKTVTFSGSNFSVAVTTNGQAVAVANNVCTVEAGEISFTITPSSGYQVTAVTPSSGSVSGEGPYTYTVSGDVTITVTTAQESSVEIGAATFEYGVDFTNATVTVAVTETNASDLEYTLTIGGKNYKASSVGGTTVTFNDVEVPRGAAYGTVSYDITSTASTTTGGGARSATVEDVTADWINERAASATGTSASAEGAGGTWTNAVTYTDGKAAISDNRFVATTASTASRVVLEFEVCFSSTSEDDVSGEAQAAIKLGESGGATTFMVLASNAAWTPVSRGDFVPDASATYKVVMTIDYGNGSYGVTVGDNVLTNASGSASFPLAKSGATSVKNIDFAGSGTLTSMKGDQVEGYMVVDKNGTRYPTIDAAIAAYNANPTIGPLKVLHAGTAPSGWKIDGNTLIKLAKGFFFMAY